LLEADLLATLLGGYWTTSNDFEQSAGLLTP